MSLPLVIELGFLGDIEVYNQILEGRYSLLDTICQYSKAYIKALVKLTNIKTYQSFNLYFH